MICDRNVVGIREDATRHTLLQIRDLTLAKALDVCKASEAAGKQLKAMAGTDEGQPLQSSKRPAFGRGGRDRSRGRGSRDDA